MIDSVLAMVQRGRGAGWLTAVAAPDEGRAALLECLRRAPRWDRQVESRATYYATLAIELDLGADEVADAADPTEGLGSGVLEELVRRGVPEAARRLARLSQEFDRPESAPAGPAVPRTPPPAADAPLEAVLRHSWGAFPRAILHRLRSTTEASEVAELRRAATDPAHPGFHLAMRALGERGDSTLVPRVGEILAGSPVGRARLSAMTYLEALPPATSLPVARAWFGLPDARGDAAEGILATHAEAEDVPRLREPLSLADDVYSQCNLVDALARVPQGGPYPELHTLFAEASYSYLRRRVTRAMAAANPSFAETFATECLWDCEGETQEIGAQHAPRTTQVLARLGELDTESVC